LSEYLDFAKPVPFQTNGRYFESALQKDDGTTNKGAFGRSIRLLPDNEFEAIVYAGHAQERLLQSPMEENDDVLGFGEDDQAEFERPLTETIVTRPYRDRAFAHQIRSAYDQRCALTGLRIINGGGRPEVQAAHIKPVSHNGSDWVRNGIALSGTVHWMFDRGLVTLDDDCRMITAKGMLPEDVSRLLNASGYARLPEQESLRPLPKYLAYHRENIFKG
jgi:putative restriction endonuclease